MTPDILIAGIGNIFLGDDAFGVKVARSLLKRRLPTFVHVKDFGIRGFDLVYALLDSWHTVILIDALTRGAAPKTLLVLKLDFGGQQTLTSPDLAFNAHSMDPMRVLALASSMGDIRAEVLVVGCEPQDFGDELEGRMGLSVPVQAAVEEASNMIECLIGQIVDSSSQTETRAQLLVLER